MPIKIITAAPRLRHPLETEWFYNTKPVNPPDGDHLKPNTLEMTPERSESTYSALAA